MAAVRRVRAAARDPPVHRVPAASGWERVPAQPRDALQDEQRIAASRAREEAEADGAEAGQTLAAARAEAAQMEAALALSLIHI
eukprot:2220315-Rhodomonas_salina.1